jgi:formyltetrahydrofolate-dependent phosphoribosylglycinamide formyltransferase
MPIPVPRPRHDPVRLAVLLSGGGTTLANLAAKIGAGELDAEVAIAISSNRKAYDKIAARELGIPTHLVARKDHADTEAFSEAIFRIVRDADVDLVCLAGFLSLLSIPDDFAYRVLNIHPALLPAFGGKGMYSHHVHEAVLAAGCKVSGCTVHFADQTYDTGPILVQRSCPVELGDTPDTLAARVFEQECLAYPEAIRLLSANSLEVDGRVLQFRPAGPG